MSGPGLSTPRVRFCSGCERALPLSRFVSAQRRCKGCAAGRKAQRLAEIRENPEMCATVARLGLIVASTEALGLALHAAGWSLRAIAIHCGVCEGTAKRWVDPTAAKEHKARRRRKGLCADCGAFAGGKSRCPKHREIHAARQR